MRITVTVDELRSLVEQAETRSPEISEWSVGMHLEHCCLAMIVIGRALIGSTPPPPPSEFSLARFLVLTAGCIPRGRARAPEAVTPAPDTDRERLLVLLDEASKQIGRVQTLGPKVWFKHFMLGVLDRDQSLKFLRVHNAHHLKIMREILHEAGPPVVG